jgi:hypothetical protein
MISITGNPFAPIVDYLDAVLQNADRVYEEAALEAAHHVEDSLNDSAEILGAKRVFKTYRHPDHGMVTAPVSDHQKIFDLEYGTLHQSPVGFVRGTIGKEDGKNFSNILTEKLYKVRPNVSSG